jgi:hypothetical protein
MKFQFGAVAIAGAIIAVGLGSSAAQAAQPLVWESNYGTAFLGGDDGSTGRTLNSAFTFYGTSYSSADVSTNGFISLGGSNGHGCCSGSAEGLLSGAPRIAVEWFDLVDTVYHNTAVAGRDVFTWEGNEYNGGGPFRLQLQLFASGQIVMGFDNPYSQFHTSLTGIAVGGSASNAGARDLSSAAPFTTTDTAIYELFGNGQFDLNGHNLVFTPQGQNGYLVTSTIPASNAVPEPAAWALMIGGFGLAGATLRRRKLIAA